MQDQLSIFEKIIHRQIPADIVYENSKVIAFNDISPMAKVHVLFVHKNKSKDISMMSDSEIIDVFEAIKKYTVQNNLHNSGYRIVNNMGDHGGQTVFHTHFHLLAGEKLGSFGRIK